MIEVYQQDGISLFDLVAKALKEQLNLESRNAGFFALPADAHDPARRQYDAKRIIEILMAKNISKSDFKLGIIDVDIYTQGMNFIFGLAEPLKRTALVSIHRLKGNRISERMAKEVVHETGHLIGLAHCSDPKCVMYFSNIINDTDNKQMGLCQNCGVKIE